MSTIAIRTDNGIPVLVIDGQDVPPEAQVTMKADDIARVVFAYTEQGAKAARTATVNRAARRREVERDDAGRIVAIVDVP